MIGPTNASKSWNNIFRSWRKNISKKSLKQKGFLGAELALTRLFITVVLALPTVPTIVRKRIGSWDTPRNAVTLIIVLILASDDLLALILRHSGFW